MAQPNKIVKIFLKKIKMIGNTDKNIYLQIANFLATITSKKNYLYSRWLSSLSI